MLVQQPNHYLKEWHSTNHISIAILKKNLRLLKKMKQMGVENFYIELIEKVECDSLEELRQREGKWIREMGTINKNIAGRTAKEYNAQHYLENKEKYNQQSRQWQEDNKERERERLAKEYQDRKEEINAKRSEKHNCECGGKYTTGHKSHNFKSKIHKSYLKEKENIE